MKRISISFVILLFLSGCLQTKIIEELAVITGRGIDVLDNNQIEKTINFIRFDPEQPELFNTYSGIAYTLKGAREKIANQVGFELSEGQLNIELYGRSAAESGISPFVMSSIRDARTSDTMVLAVADGTAKEIFTADSIQSKTIGRFLSELIEKEVNQGTIPPSSLQDFMQTATTKGQDGALPLIGIREGIPSIIGMTLFDDEVAAVDINPTQGRLLTLFLGKWDNLSIEMTLPTEPFKNHMGKNPILNRKVEEDKESFAIEVLAVKEKSNTKMKDVKKLSYQTDIYMEVNLLEVTMPILIDNKKLIHLFEKEIAKQFEQQLDELLTVAKEAHTDPFGFGKIYRINKKDGILTEKEWHEKFPNIQVDFNIDVKLMHTGTIQ